MLNFGFARLNQTLEYQGKRVRQKSGRRKAKGEIRREREREGHERENRRGGREGERETESALMKRKRMINTKFSFFPGLLSNSISQCFL